MTGLATTIEHNGHQTTISVFDNECPSRLTLELIADKWTVLVIASIHEGANRKSRRHATASTRRVRRA